MAGRHYCVLPASSVGTHCQKINVATEQDHITSPSLSTQQCPREQAVKTSHKHEKELLTSLHAVFLIGCEILVSLCFGYKYYCPLVCSTVQFGKHEDRTCRTQQQFILLGCSCSPSSFGGGNVVFRFAIQKL
jgi:hypothetical protein